MDFFDAAFAGLDSDCDLLRFDLGSTIIVLRVLRNQLKDMLPNQLELHSVMSPVVGQFVACQGIGNVMSQTDSPATGCDNLSEQFFGFGRTTFVHAVHLVKQLLVQMELSH